MKVTMAGDINKLMNILEYILNIRLCKDRLNSSVKALRSRALRKVLVQ